MGLLVVPAIREAVWELDPNMPVPTVRSMEDMMASTVVDERFYATFLYSVRQRQREMGIRIALDAPAQDIIRVVLGSGLVLTSVGVALGLAAAAGTAP